MAIVKPFKGLRPSKDKVKEVASKPYDVINTAEVRVEVVGKPYSFLHIVRSEVDLPEHIDVHSQAVYDKAKENLQNFVKNGVLFQDEKEHFYLYRQIMNGHSQVGLICCASIEDYENNIIKKHEFTRPVKENDRINHVKTTGIHSGPVFSTYPEVKEMDVLVSKRIQNTPEYDFIADDGVQHTVWLIDNHDDINFIVQLFNEKVPYTYIADGHHRAASAFKVGKEMRENNPNHNGKEEYNFFLTVYFPANQLAIIDYNRVVCDLNGLTESEFISKIEHSFSVEKVNYSLKPLKALDFGMYLNNQWYKLTAKPNTFDNNDPVNSIDAAILQNNILTPILDIDDPRTNDRVDFVGGIRGLGELEKRVNSGEMAAAFSVFPVSIQQLIDVANSGNVMPPKCTWFEPKLRSGVVAHYLAD